MSGGHIANFKKLFRLRIMLALLLNGITILAASLALRQYTNFDEVISFGIISILILVLGVIQAYIVSAELTKPTEYLAQAIFHISPNQHLVAAPNIDELRFGRELISNLTRQIYDFSATSHAVSGGDKKKISNRELLDSLPVCIIGLNSEGKVAFTNKSTIETFGFKETTGIPLSSLIRMKFNGQTIDEWAVSEKSKNINSSKVWYKVEISADDGDTRNYFDIAATYRQKHPSGIELLMVLFAQTEVFESEQDTLNLIALSVHEVRTPLTILRGYIEVLRQELDGKVDQPTQGYIDRLSAASENLASFMANILNVAKADQSQLKLQLQETDWPKLLTSIVESQKVRATVRGKEIKLNISGTLPTVAVENISINEVMTNLIDNAIKYSPEGKNTIWVDSNLQTDGSVLTTVRDEGVGIPDSVVQNLFTRFFRNHRNKEQISGTGLGLFISKEIINGHHGQISVNSKEGVGTTIGFTLIPYSKLADSDKTSDNGFSQVTHGWIKNHSMQRR